MKIKTINTEYLGKADETLDTIIIDGCYVAFIHTDKNGYYSVIEGANNLYEYLSGKTDVRSFCSDDWADIENYLETCSAGN